MESPAAGNAQSLHLNVPPGWEALILLSLPCRIALIHPGIVSLANPLFRYAGKWVKTVPLIEIKLYLQVNNLPCKQKARRIPT
jgi:hypothetical protein